MAVDVLRKDISSQEFYLVDLGLTPQLVKTINDKAKGRQKVCYLDHHQQSGNQLPQLDPRAESLVREGVSAASVAYTHIGLNGDHRHLVAIADLVEYCPSPMLSDLETRLMTQTSRADDYERRNHSEQYVSHPHRTWQRFARNHHPDTTPTSISFRANGPHRNPT